MDRQLREAHRSLRELAARCGKVHAVPHLEFAAAHKELERLERKLNVPSRKRDKPPQPTPTVRDSPRAAPAATQARQSDAPAAQKKSFKPIGGSTHASNVKRKTISVKPPESVRPGMMRTAPSQAPGQSQRVTQPRTVSAAPSVTPTEKPATAPESTSVMPPPSVRSPQPPKRTSSAPKKSWLDAPVPRTSLLPTSKAKRTSVAPGATLRSPKPPSHSAPPPLRTSGSGAFQTPLDDEPSGVASIEGPRPPSDDLISIDDLVPDDELDVELDAAEWEQDASAIDEEPSAVILTSEPGSLASDIEFTDDDWDD